jgi:hypothetical protein
MCYKVVHPQPIWSSHWLQVNLSVLRFTLGGTHLVRLPLSRLHLRVPAWEESTTRLQQKMVSGAAVVGAHSAQF